MYCWIIAWCLRQFIALTALMHAGALPYKQRQKSDKAADPLKGVFMRAPKKGGDVGEPLTEIESKAQVEGARLAKKLAKRQGGAFVPKRNVRSAKNFRKH